MFGFSFGEVVVLVIVAIVLVGPRQLPSMLRTAGQWVAKLRRMAFDMRSQSGIDKLLQDEGLERDLRELRRLLAIRRGNVLDALTVDIGAEVDATPGPAKAKTKRAQGASSRDDVVTLSNEYPLQGADAYGAVPEDVAPYGEGAAQVERSDTRHGASDGDRAAGSTAGLDAEVDARLAGDRGQGPGGAGDAGAELSAAGPGTNDRAE